MVKAIENAGIPEKRVLTPNIEGAFKYMGRQFAKDEGEGFFSRIIFEDKSGSATFVHETGKMCVIFTFPTYDDKPVVIPEDRMQQIVFEITKLLAPYYQFHIRFGHDGQPGLSNSCPIETCFVRKQFGGDDMVDRFLAKSIMEAELVTSVVSNCIRLLLAGESIKDLPDEVKRIFLDTEGN